MTQELKPCPFCNSRGIDRDNYWHHNYCTNCGGRGPAAGNSVKADWNTRAAQQPTLAEALALPEGRALVDVAQEAIARLGYSADTFDDQGCFTRAWACRDAAEKLRAVLAAQEGEG